MSVALQRWLAIRWVVPGVVLSVVLGIVLGACGQGGDAPDSKSVPASWVIASAMPGHATHLGKSTSIDGAPRVIRCDDCHGSGASTGKDFVGPGATACARCHGAEAEHGHPGSPMQPTTCLTCHLFARGKDAPAQAPTCVQCHASPQGALPALAHHATDKASCNSCHVVHAKTPTVEADCTTCHQDTAAHHGKLGVLAGTASAGNARVCSACHAPHAAAKEAAMGCAGCHVAGSVKKGASVTGPLVAEAPKVVPQGNHVAGHEACTTCHAPHDAEKATVRPCTGCHADHTAVSTNPGHAQCTSCHAPHAPTVSARASCNGCHAGHAALGTPEVAAHVECTSCHAVHAPTRDPERACKGCHASVDPKHPAVTTSATSAATHTCIACHTPHPKGATAIARPCTSCHADLARTDEALHAPTKLACTGCHQSHEFVLARPPSATFCVRCHTKVEKKVASMHPPTGPGHGDCIGCHGADAHAPALAVNCSTCHVVETKTAGGHGACASCHASHSGALTVGAIAKPTALAATAAFCTSCHASKKKAPHTELAGGCSNCHRAHGPVGVPTPPPCGSCHAPSKLAGLHATTAHAANCSACHAAHVEPKATRETCTATCHLDRRSHQPDAATCQGCHFF